MKGSPAHCCFPSITQLPCEPCNHCSTAEESRMQPSLVDDLATTAAVGSISQCCCSPWVLWVPLDSLFPLFPGNVVLLLMVFESCSSKPSPPLTWKALQIDIRTTEIPTDMCKWAMACHLVFSTSFISLESPCLTKFCDCFSEVGICTCTLLREEVRTGHRVPPWRNPQEAQKIGVN